MFARAVRIARLGGIEVRLDPSLGLFVLLVVWVFVGRFRPVHGLTTAAVMATAATVLFFASVLAHELGHALEARHRRLEVQGITLFLFGGVTEMHAHGQTPRDELAIAAVGPWVSLLCGAVFGIVATFAPEVFPAGVGGPVAEVAGVLGWLNVTLAVFNLVPGAPLDGGRVLRAVLWMTLKDRQRALRISARAGQALGIGLVLVSLWTWTRTGAAAAPGVNPAALLVPVAMGVLVGVFLFNAARSELRNAELDQLFSERRVADLVGALPQPVPVDQLLDLVDERGLSRGSDLLPVVDADGELVGVLEVAMLRELHPTDRSVRTAGELATDVADLPGIDLDADLHALVDRFQGEHRTVRLVRDGRAVAAVTQREIGRAVANLKATGDSGRPPAEPHLPVADPEPRP